MTVNERKKTLYNIKGKITIVRNFTSLAETDFFLNIFLASKVFSELLDLIERLVMSKLSRKHLEEELLLIVLWMMRN
jgi:hypothetical protein